MVRESPDELALRAEEAGTWKSSINVDHRKVEVRSSPGRLWLARCTQALKEKAGEQGCGS